MAEPKWTPGPWRVGREVPQYDNEGYYVHANGLLIARLWAVDSRDPETANANLIAAAPDLYTYLVGCLSMLLAARAEGSGPPPTTYELLNMRGYALRALARARGEQP
jgi:hypothetical protein